MSSTWIETPIENAKEVVQRIIDDPSKGFNDFTDKLIAYGEDSEVFLNSNDIFKICNNPSKIYFGNLYTTTVDDQGILLLTSDLSDSYITYDSAGYPSPVGVVPVMFNNIVDAPTGNSYFIGYGFNLVKVSSTQARIRMQVGGTGTVFGFELDTLAPSITVDWGDGNVEVISTPGNIWKFLAQHNYPASNGVTYDVTIYCENPITIFWVASFIGTDRPISYIETSDIRYINNLWLEGTFNQDDINDILVDLDTYATVPGQVITSVNTPLMPPTGRGIIAKQSLINKGWTVTTD